MEKYILYTAIGAFTVCISITIFFIYIFWKEHREAQNQNAQRWWRHLSGDERFIYFLEESTEPKTIRKLYKKHLRKYK